MRVIPLGADAPSASQINSTANTPALAGNMPKDKEKLLLQLREAMAGQRALRPFYCTGFEASEKKGRRILELEPPSLYPAGYGARLDSTQLSVVFSVPMMWLSGFLKARVMEKMTRITPLSSRALGTPSDMKL